MILLSNFEKLLCRPLILYTGAFILGIMCRGPSRGNGTGITIIPAVITAFVIFIGGSLLLVGEKRMQKPFTAGAVYKTVIWLICPLFCFAGYSRTIERNIESPLKSYLSRSTDAAVRGIISDISVRSDGFLLTLTDCRVNITDQYLKAGKINIIVPDGTDTYDNSPGGEPPGLMNVRINSMLEKYGIGDTVSAEGRLYPYESATNYGQFDSELYYRIRGIDAKMYAEGERTVTFGIADGSEEVEYNGKNDEIEKNVVINETEDGNRAYIETGLFDRIRYALGNILLRVRMRLICGIYAVLPEKEAGVLTAMLTGERGLLDSELKDLYSDGGIAHILSISALHVTLLGMGFFRLMMFLTSRLRLSGILTIKLMLMYGAVTGFSVSTRRAVIMLIVTLCGRMIGRAYDRLSAAGLAALIILVSRPLYIYDAGFRMSFMAVVGINTVMWIIDVYEIEKPVLKAVLPCIGVQVFTLPVIMGTYYEISIYALFVNPLILIFMAVLLVSGAFAGGLGGITAGNIALNGVYKGPVDMVARIFAGPVYFILKLYEWLCEAELRLPYSKIVTGAPYTAAVIIYYTVLLAVMILLIRKKKLYVLPALVLCTCVFFRVNMSCEAYFIDVGQGDSEFIRCNGTNILIDGGSSNVSDVGTYRLTPFLKYLGVTGLDTVIISHTDADHVNGILKLIEQGYPRIGRLVVGCNVGDEDKVVKAAEQAGITVEKVRAGDTISGGDGAIFAITAIAPEEKVLYKDKNEASLAVILRYRSFSILLTGDSGKESERRYKEFLKDPVSVLKVAHHGSKYSSSEEMLKAALPTAACISCSKTNSYGHPAPETVARLQNAGSRLFTTPECGMIIMRYAGGEEFEVSVYKQGVE